MHWLMAFDRSALMLLLGAGVVGSKLYPYCLTMACISFGFTVLSFTIVDDYHSKA